MPGSLHASVPEQNETVCTSPTHEQTNSVLLLLLPGAHGILHSTSYDLRKQNKNKQTDSVFIVKSLTQRAKRQNSLEAEEEHCVEATGQRLAWEKDQSRQSGQCVCSVLLERSHPGETS